MPSLPRASRLRARVTGSIDWGCPRCSTLNKSRLAPRIFSVSCSSCSGRYYVGLVFHPIIRSTPAHAAPTDMLLPSHDGATLAVKPGKAVVPPFVDQSEYPDVLPEAMLSARRVTPTDPINLCLPPQGEDADTASQSMSTINPS